MGWRRALRTLLMAALTGMWLGAGAFPLLAAPQGQERRVEITSPRMNAVLQGRVNIQGSASIPNFQFYKVEYGAGLEPTQWIIIGNTHFQPVEDGLLETWDTTLVPDGSYTLLLTVVDITGNYQEYRVQNLVVANAQPTPTLPLPSILQETPTPTATPPLIPAPPTPTPILVEQPEVVKERETIPTPQLQPVIPTPRVANPLEQLVRGLGLDACGQAFCIGAVVIGFFAILIAGGGILRWLIRLALRRGPEEGS